MPTNRIVLYKRAHLPQSFRKRVVHLAILRVFNAILSEKPLHPSIKTFSILDCCCKLEKKDHVSYSYLLPRHNSKISLATEKEIKR